MSRTMVVRLRHVLGWLAVVVVTAAVTTVIVTGVGRDVSGDSIGGGSVALPPGLVGASTPTSPAAESESGEGPSSPGPGSATAVAGVPAGRTPSTTGRGAASASELGGPGGAAADTGPGVSGDRATGGSWGTSDDRSGSSTGSPPAVTGGAATRTFSTPGGAAVVGCRGDQPYARSVTPRYGWSFETEAEAVELDVTFKQPGQEYSLHLVCRGGQPVLTEGYGAAHD